MTTTSRKQLLAFINAVKIDVDIKIIRPPITPSLLDRLKNLKDYDLVFVTSFDIPGETSPISQEDAETISDHLVKDGFGPPRRFETGYKTYPCSLLIFEKPTE